MVQEILEDAYNHLRSTVLILIGGRGTLKERLIEACAHHLGMQVDCYQELPEEINSGLLDLKLSLGGSGEYREMVEGLNDEQVWEAIKKILNFYEEVIAIKMRKRDREMGEMGGTVL